MIIIPIRGICIDVLTQYSVLSVLHHQPNISYSGWSTRRCKRVDQEGTTLILNDAAARALASGGKLSEDNRTFEGGDINYPNLPANARDLTEEEKVFLENSCGVCNQKPSIEKTNSFSQLFDAPLYFTILGSIIFGLFLTSF